MGLIQPTPYRRLNKETGIFEWVYPAAVEYEKKDPIKRIDVRTNKKKKRR